MMRYIISSQIPIPTKIELVAKIAAHRLCRNMIAYLYHRRKKYMGDTYDIIAVAS